MANKGKVVQVIGAVIDVKFNSGRELPNLFNAIEIEMKDGHKVVAEVTQHVGRRCC